MSQSTLAIGDTGAELVEKFNNNFTEVYSSIGEADTAFSVYNIIDYNCIDDGVTDNTTAFNAFTSRTGAILTFISNDGTLKANLVLQNDSTTCNVLASFDLIRNDQIQI